MPRRLLSLIVWFILVSCLLCAGCARAGSTQPPLTSGFACDVAMHYRDMDVKGRLTRGAAGTLKMEFEAPSSLKGMSMEWDGETMSAKMYGMTFEVDPASVPESALGRSLLDVLDSAMRDKDAGELTEDGLRLNGETASGAYEMLSDPDTGNLISLKVPSLNLTADFSNFETAQTSAGTAATAE